jgi:hypothetical protein
MIRRLGESGANFARVWACSEDWALAIEARKSAWGRSWAWNPPFAPMPDDEGGQSGRLCVRISGDAGASAAVSPCHRVALKPNTRYRLTGRVKADGGVGLAFDLGGPRTVAGAGQWTQFSEEFTAAAGQPWLQGPTFRLTAKGAAWLRDLSLKEAAGGPELLWEADPNRPALGVYNQPDCYMLDRVLEAAEQSGVRLQVVLLTRDLYMPMLAKDGAPRYAEAVAAARRLLRYAVARWGYSTHIAAWEYFNEMNPGMPTDRFYSELGETLERTDPYRHLRATSTWSSPSKDYRHPQLDTADLHFYLRPAAGEMWKDAAAAVLARWQAARRQASARPILFSEFGMTDDNWRHAPQLDEDKDFVHLHNGLWASALSGFASTVCHWFWDDIHRRDLYYHYRPIAAFVADIPFTTARFRPAAAACTNGLRAIGLQGDACAYLWLADPQATWWKIAMEGAQPAETSGAAVTLAGLSDGAYHVRWWNTWKGEVVKQAPAQAAAGTLRLDVPPFTRDIACKIVRPAAARAGP